MAFTQSSLVDIIFKKFITNQGTVDNTKQYFEEPYSSIKNVVNTDIWLQSDQIPTTATAVPGIVQYVTLTMSYVSGTRGGFYNANLVDIIPFNYATNSSYNYQIFRNNGTTPIALGQSDWLLDPNAGTLTFYSGAVSGTITDPITSNVIATPALPPVVRVYKYIGKKGVIPNLNGLTYSGGTMSINVGNGLTFSGGQLITTSGLLSAGQGMTLSGNTFSLSISGNGLTFSNNNLSLNIGSGLTFSNGQLQTILTTSAGNGLTNSGNTFSILLDSTPGLTLSSSGLKILSSLIVVTSSVTLGTDVIGQYATDPTTSGSWGALSIPTKNYVDSIATGLNLKQAVRVAATGSINLSSAPPQIDGVTLSNNDRVLIWRQDNTSNGTSSNGIYVYGGSGSAMTRSLDFDGQPTSEVTTGSYTFVTDGVTYQGAGFVVVAIGTASGQILVGTQSMRWSQFNSTISYNFNNGLIETGNIVDIDLANNSGLTFSSSKLLVSLPPSSGLQLGPGGLSLDSNINGTGLTFSSGQLSLINPIYFGRGITNSGNTYSIDISSNGLTFSNNQISLNLGSGLTFSSGQLSNTSTINVGNGLTSSGNTYSVNLNSNGLTFSNSQISLNIGNGLTFSSSQLRTDLIIGGGLTQSGPTISVVAGNGIEVNGLGQLVTKVDTSSGLYNNTGNNYIYWAGILGSGLTWSGSQLNTTSALLQRYSTTLTFTASQTQLITHNLGTSDFIIQIYDNLTGDEVLAQYQSRTTTQISVTTFDNITGRVVIIG